MLGYVLLATVELLRLTFCTGVCGQGLSYVFAAPPIKYFVIFLRLSIANPNPNPNLKP